MDLPIFPRSPKVLKLQINSNCCVMGEPNSLLALCVFGIKGLLKYIYIHSNTFINKYVFVLN